MESIAAELVGILVLILLNGFFAAAEIAVIALRRGRVRQLLEDGVRGAATVQRLHADPDRFFATVQIGVTVVSTLAAALGGASAARVLQPVLAGSGSEFLRSHAEALTLALVVVPIAFLSLVLGELVPKSLALRWAQAFALRVARPIELLGKATAPLVWILTRTSNLLLRPFGDRTSFSESRITLEEIRAIVDEGGEAGTVPPVVGDLVERAFDFGDLRVADVLVPRSDVMAIDASADDLALRAVLARYAHSRMPVVQGGLDNVVGYVLLRDLVADLVEGRRLELKARLRPPVFVPLTLPVQELVRRFRTERERLAFVVDEFGGVAGIVTAGDVLSELATGLTGAAERQEERVERHPDGVVIAGGEAPLREVERALDEDLPRAGGSVTIGGLVTAVAERIPEKGEEFVLGIVRARVLERGERQVLRVRLERGSDRPAPPKEEPPAAPP